ncbi:ras-related GTP-binding A [Brachionus plicatilis]|uniref:Ras-related GTP-binding A n=1 Tax=Brachionus plicatilis TaxID=10195 RepID=A0A3M7R3Y1_BRAPC|nr:ras-related GTP-binding A [Brachionus plicatilis]
MRKKILLMGKSGSGKTSMRAIIFANYTSKDTRRLGATIEVNQAYFKFLGNLILNLWDCGGQDQFMENYFSSQRDNIFKNVEVLIYVFDVESFEIERDIFYYQRSLESLSSHSPNAKIFVLTFQKRKADILKYSKPLEIRCFQTSIWDETLYRAWSSIVQELVMNSSLLEKSLNEFSNVIEADEILLFEKTTFLIVSQSLRKQHSDLKRFEKISNIIKQFKINCNRFDTTFQSIEIKNDNFTIIIDTFTPNTYIMVIVSDPKITPALTIHNIKYAQKHFEKLESQT